MPVRIVKAHHPLTLGVLYDRMNIFNVSLLQPVCKFIKIILFKINLKIIAAKGNLIRTDELLISFKCLQGQPSGQCFVRTKIHDDMKSKHFFIKLD